VEESAKEIIARIKATQDERSRLLDQLRMWVEVKDQGIDPEAVDRFGYDVKLLTHNERQAFLWRVRKRLPDEITGEVERDIEHPYTRERRPSGFYRSAVYNYVRMKDGSVVELHPPIKAAPK
jgi:anti-sigma regulatory factor (Ser/Thr protein kinase)